MAKRTGSTCGRGTTGTITTGTLAHPQQRPIVPWKSRRSSLTRNTSETCVHT